MIDSLFFELLQVSVVRRGALSRCPAAAEWAELFQMAKKQALVGVTASAIERLPQEQRPPKSLMQQWAILTVQVEQQNQWLNAKCAEVTEFLQQEGFDTCILKGQGMAQRYPNPLRRQSGDIDVWVMEKQYRSDIDQVIKDIQQIFPHARFRYHHADIEAKLQRNEQGQLICLTEIKEGEKRDAIEIHFRPSYSLSPFRNFRMQRWFTTYKKFQRTSLGFFVPSHSFNAVYILSHIFRHLFDEGIGLRQILDYYYVIQACASLSCREKELINQTLRRMGLYSFCQAIMYVLHRVMGLPQEAMITKMNEKKGRFVLDEIMMAGNFGHYDSRVQHGNRTKWDWFVLKQKRSIRFFSYFPEESLSSPYYNIYQYLWRWRRGFL